MIKMEKTILKFDISYFAIEIISKVENSFQFYEIKVLNKDLDKIKHFKVEQNESISFIDGYKHNLKAFKRIFNDLYIPRLKSYSFW